MRTLVIPDIHTKWKIAQLIIDSVPHDSVVFTGDAFDAFGDTPFENIDTAKWLSDFIQGDNHVALDGNHDMAYKYDSNVTRCSGFTVSKQKAINNAIDPKIWAKTKLYHVEQGFLFTHAGLSFPLYRWMSGDKKDFDLPQIEEFLGKAAPDAISQIPLEITHRLLGVGHYRGGDQQIGGVTWCDINEFKPIPHVNQIFGHTPQTKPKAIYIENGSNQVRYFDKFIPSDGMASINYALDTGLHYYGLIEDGKFTAHQVPPFSIGQKASLNDKSLKDLYNSVIKK